MTLLSWTDSVTINFTFQASEMERPADLELCSGDSVYRCDRYSPLFTDIKKNGYEIRITSAFSAAAIKAVISSKEPPATPDAPQAETDATMLRPSHAMIADHSFCGKAQTAVLRTTLLLGIALLLMPRRALCAKPQRFWKAAA